MEQTMTATTKQSKSFTNEEMQQALFYIQDILERAMIPFMLFGIVAKKIEASPDADIKGEKVEIGILKRHLTGYGKSTLRAFIVWDDVDGKMVLDYKGVPIEITIVNDDYLFLRNPDTRWYKVTEFKIPNPFEDYWKNRKDVH